MIRILSVAALLAGTAIFTLPAGAEEDELVRLPSTGTVRDAAVRQRVKADRLRPAGGLFVSFDSNEDGLISVDEIQAGIPLAFADADANQDGELTAIEQQAWADSLPTRDDSLANPVRFDPNLDRRVSLEEFTTVIRELGLDYADKESGNIIVADLKAPHSDRPGPQAVSDEITPGERAARTRLPRGDRATINR